MTQPRSNDEIRADLAELDEPHATLAKAETYDRLLRDVAPLLAALAAQRDRADKADAQWEAAIARMRERSRKASEEIRLRALVEAERDQLRAQMERLKRAPADDTLFICSSCEDGECDECGGDGDRPAWCQCEHHPDSLSAIQAERDQLAAQLQAVTTYVDDPGNWSALDGRRGHLLGLLGVPVDPEEDADRYHAPWYRRNGPSTVCAKGGLIEGGRCACLTAGAGVSFPPELATKPDPHIRESVTPLRDIDKLLVDCSCGDSGVVDTGAGEMDRVEQWHRSHVGRGGVSSPTTPPAETIVVCRWCYSTNLDGAEHSEGAGTCFWPCGHPVCAGDAGCDACP